MQSVDTLVRMANQISKFFHVQGEERAIKGIADHMGRFWEPRMKTAIFAHVDAGGEGLEPVVIKAVNKLQEKYGSSLDAGSEKKKQPVQQAQAKAKSKAKTNKAPKAKARAG